MTTELDETTWHVIKAYRHLMTEAERRAEHAFVLQMKMRESQNSPVDDQFALWFKEALDDPTAAEHFKKGRTQLLVEVAERLLREHADEIVRCARCNGMLRTPRGKQCLHCGHDWH